MYKNVVETEATDENTIRRMHFACWVTKATKRIQNMYYLLLFHSKNFKSEFASVLLCIYLVCVAFSVNASVKFVKGPYSSTVHGLLVSKKTEKVIEPQEGSMGDKDCLYF
jgi:hypothetical protein